MASRIDWEQAVQIPRAIWGADGSGFLDYCSHLRFSLVQSITPRSQTALHILASMDPLVLSRSSRALLAFMFRVQLNPSRCTDAVASGNGSNWRDVELVYLPGRLPPYQCWPGMKYQLVAADPPASMAETCEDHCCGWPPWG